MMKAYQVKVKFPETSQLIPGIVYFKGKFFKISLNEKNEQNIILPFGGYDFYFNASHLIQRKANLPKKHFFQKILRIFKLWVKKISSFPRFSRIYFYYSESEKLSNKYFIEYIQIGGLFPFNILKKREILNTYFQKPERIFYFQGPGILIIGLVTIFPFLLYSFHTLSVALTIIFSLISTITVCAIGIYFYISISKLIKSHHEKERVKFQKNIFLIFLFIFAILALFLWNIWISPFLRNIIFFLIVLLSLSILLQLRKLVLITLVIIFLNLFSFTAYELTKFQFQAVTILGFYKEKGLDTFRTFLLSFPGKIDRNTYKNEKLHFSIKKPDNWVYIKPGFWDIFWNIHPGRIILHLHKKPESKTGSPYMKFIYMSEQIDNIDILKNHYYKQMNFLLNQGVIKEPEVVKYEYESFPIRGAIVFPIGIEYSLPDLDTDQRLTYYYLKLRKGALLVECLEDLLLDSDGKIKPSETYEVVRKIRIYLRKEKKKDLKAPPSSGA
jgi:hypothetical protein